MNRWSKRRQRAKPQERQHVVRFQDLPPHLQEEMRPMAQAYLKNHGLTGLERMLVRLPPGFDLEPPGGPSDAAAG